MIDWQNPYWYPGGSWFKGSLHNHTSPNSPCGRVALPRVIELYEAAGFDFLAISDHLCRTEVKEPTSMVMLPGLEWNSWPDNKRRQLSHANHIGFYALDGALIEKALDFNRPDRALENFTGKQILAIMNHPNGLTGTHYDEETLFRLYDTGKKAGLQMGVEVHNDLSNFEPGSGDASFKWDRLLSEKGPVIGFASDDSHHEKDIGRAWLMVNAEEKTASSIFKAICEAHFYMSTGVIISDIGRDGDLLYCRTENKDVAIDIIGENGFLAEEGKGQLEFNCADFPSKYFRFVLYGQGKQKAWSQPFYVREEKK